MQKENKNLKFERETFLLRCSYEKELHSNKNSFATLGFMVILGVISLTLQANNLINDTKEVNLTRKPVPYISSKKTNMLYVAQRSYDCSHTR